MEAAQVLRDARHHRGLSQRELAARTGVPQSAIARLESGQVVPRFDTLNRLLSACDATLELKRPLGVGIDRTAMRELLKLSPDERFRRAAESSRSLADLILKLQRRP